MKTLFIDASMGAAGDMLTAALLELVNNKKEILEKLNSLPIPNTTISSEPSSKCGIYGTHVRVEVSGKEEGEMEHHHHHHHHHHSHRTLHDIEHIVSHFQLDEAIKQDILSVYKKIAQAESVAHQKPVTDIHFHEVGTMDAIMDVTAVCVLMHELNVENVVCSPIHVGRGHVHCAHGILPVPAPATAYILKDVPIYSADIEGELCTPTGAALLKHFVDEFRDMPMMQVSKIGYGMGNKDFERANCVRVLLGETSESIHEETVVELSCNLDDMTAESISFAMERLFEVGALDVYTLPIGMKKSRSATMLCVMCRESDKYEILQAMFKHTSTLGIRQSKMERFVLNRTINSVETSLGTLRQKVSSGYGVNKSKWEYDDVSKIAKERDMSIEEVKETLNHEI